MMTTTDAISASMADREKAHLFRRVPKHHWAYLAAGVIVACCIAMLAVWP